MIKTNNIRIKMQKRQYILIYHSITYLPIIMENLHQEMLAHGSYLSPTVIKTQTLGNISLNGNNINVKTSRSPFEEVQRERDWLLSQLKVYVDDLEGTRRKAQQKQGEVQFLIKRLEAVEGALRQEQSKRNDIPQHLNTGEMAFLNSIVLEKDKQLSLMQETLKIIEGQRKWMEQRLSVEAQQRKQLQMKHLGEIQKIKQQNQKAMEENSVAIQIRNRQLRMKQMFVGQTLEENYDLKEYLLSSIETETNKKIAATRFTYRHKGSDRTNIHNFIDGKENLVVVMRLANGKVLAVWTQGEFRLKTKSDVDRVFLFSLTNRLMFEQERYVKQNEIQHFSQYNNSLFYPFVLGFGNADLVIEGGMVSAFKFGTKGSCFSQEGNVDVLLGEGATRKVGLSTYEFYQIQFK